MNHQQIVNIIAVGIFFLSMSLPLFLVGIEAIRAFIEREKRRINPYSLFIYSRFMNLGYKHPRLEEFYDSGVAFAQCLAISSVLFAGVYVIEVAVLLTIHFPWVPITTGSFIGFLLIARWVRDVQKALTIHVKNKEMHHVSGK